MQPRAGRCRCHRLVATRCRHMPTGATKAPRGGTVRISVFWGMPQNRLERDVKSDVSPKYAGTGTTRQGARWGSRPLPSRVARDRHPQPLTPPDARHHRSRHGGGRERLYADTRKPPPKGGRQAFRKPPPGARTAFQPTRESLASREIVAEVPLTGLSFYPL